MSVVDVQIYVAFDESFDVFAQAVADILMLKLIVTESDYYRYMLTFHVGQGIYVQCYVTESGYVYSTVDNDYGLFEYRLEIRVLWTDRIKGQLELPR